MPWNINSSPRKRPIGPDNNKSHWVSGCKLRLLCFFQSIPLAQSLILLGWIETPTRLACLKWWVVWTFSSWNSLFLSNVRTHPHGQLDMHTSIYTYAYIHNNFFYLSMYLSVHLSIPWYCYLYRPNVEVLLRPKGSTSVATVAMAPTPPTAVVPSTPNPSMAQENPMVPNEQSTIDFIYI